MWAEGWMEGGVGRRRGWVEERWVGGWMGEERVGGWRGGWE